MQTFLKVFILIMILLIVVPPLFNVNPVPFDVKLSNISTISNDFVPFPSFPSFPEIEDPIGFLFSLVEFLYSVFEWVYDIIYFLTCNTSCVIRIIRTMVLS